MNDTQKLNKLAEWFDFRDAQIGNPNNEVQCDLRRIARRIAELEADKEKLQSITLAQKMKIEGLEGKTGFCAQCEEWARKYKTLKKEFEGLRNNNKPQMPSDSQQ